MSFVSIELMENDHMTLTHLIYDPSTAADRNDPGILDPGEEVPTNSCRSFRSASNTGKTKCWKYQNSYLNYGYISFSRSKECIICAKARQIRLLLYIIAYIFILQMTY